MTGPAVCKTVSTRRRRRPRSPIGSPLADAVVIIRMLPEASSSPIHGVIRPSQPAVHPTGVSARGAAEYL